MMLLPKSVLRLTFLLFPLFSFAQKKTNIVIIISDDHAYQAVSAYGRKLAHTPNIDRIAKEGVRFDRAYVTNSICGPSRAVLLTGKYSHKNGFRDHNGPGFDGAQPTFIKELGKAGYQTGWIGKWHLKTAPQGFTYWKIFPGQGYYFNPELIKMDGSTERIEGYASNIVEDIAEEWLDQRDTSRPFCLVIGHKAAHRTWMPDTPDLGRFDRVTFPLPENFYDPYTGRQGASLQEMSIAKDMRMGYDLKMFDSKEAAEQDANIKRMTPAQRAKFDAYYDPIQADLNKRKLPGNALAEWKYQRYMRDYLSTAASIDRNVGRTLDYLDKHGLTENTLVIYVSDQGFYLGEHGWFDKRWMYEESFRTPMVMRYPGVVKPGGVNNNMVMNLDIAPTVLEAAGVKAPADMQGASFLPLVAGKPGKGREVLYYHYYENGEHAVSPHFGISTGRYKLIRMYKKIDDWELYDLEKDPAEMNDLYGKKGYEALTARLKEQLKQTVRKYEDTDAEKVLLQ